jgi:hypothetical protein
VFYCILPGVFRIKVKARIVRCLFGEYNSGKSLSAIANMLNKEKITPRWNNDKGWRATG